MKMDDRSRGNDVAGIVEDTGLQPVAADVDPTQHQLSAVTEIAGGRHAIDIDTETMPGEQRWIEQQTDRHAPVCIADRDAIFRGEQLERVIRPEESPVAAGRVRRIGRYRPLARARQENRFGILQRPVGEDGAAVRADAFVDLAGSRQSGHQQEGQQG